MAKMKKPIVFVPRTERRDDPDETEGRRLYRERADSEAAVEMFLAGHHRRVSMVNR